MEYKDYINLGYKPSKDDLVCDFYVEARGDLRKAIGGVAAESSIGTWITTGTMKPYMLKLAARVFEIKKIRNNSANIKIAYPCDLFEYGSVPNIMSSIAGNIFGMKDISNLRLNDIEFPRPIVKNFKGPKYGIEGIRKIIKIYNRPLTGTIVKPKLGLNSKDHAKVAYDAWVGGIDITKDDENLCSQRFNRFEERLKETFKMKEKAEKETGEKKMYMINVTAETKEMIKRAKLVENIGNEYCMVDIITTGWSSLQTLRNEDFNLVLHAHRAGHAAFDRNTRHGINMRVIARLTRLIGLDQLHVGAAIGKMFETHEDAEKNAKALTEEFYGLKRSMPVASGGLHPLMIPGLCKIFDKDVVLQFGGGLHGNKLGTRLGATAIRQAVDASVEGISLEEYAKDHCELKKTIAQFGRS